MADGENRRLATCAIIGWAVFLLMLVMVLTGQSSWIDQFAPNLRQWGSGSSFLFESVRDLTALGGVFLRLVVAALAASMLFIFGYRYRALVLAAAVLSGWLANSLLKLVVGRARPDPAFQMMDAIGNSFPSGHSFNGAVLWISLAALVAPLLKHPAARKLLWWACIITSLGIGWSRLWLGVHYPTDSIAGVFGGAAWAMTFILCARIFQMKATSVSSDEPSSH
ncbi:phosphatase PAP2 family protein [Altericroceibacterium endophyticum]|uniref:Phosphatase PAP2 family protein n=1 Tax=Altericroceibacterium endophyticum TaxID=1808508 RepID=A0A6I4T363_9SPHN|nr:phosphatase PAP2 family protein [Altericroceibacterium endophyticum]MXO64679.1 phosphatase PAP2 family protein [Altericroceibacterium endophyticum]